MTSLVDQGVQEFKVEADLTSFLLDSLKGGYMYHVQVQALSEFELGDGEDGIFRTCEETPIYVVLLPKTNKSRVLWLDKKVSTSRPK